MALSELGTVLLDLLRGAARASVLAGDTTKARKAFKDFFELWKDADQNLPILIRAKKDYAALH
jgi:eukaryotic-like serine/threonine-protein kinase